jgi:hypothetical protein
MVLPDSDGVSRVPPYSGYTPEETTFRLQGCYLVSQTFPVASPTLFLCNSVWSVLQPQEASLLVWAVSVSLAATQEIAFAFSSSGYLDVSVPQVCLLISYVFRYGYHPITDGGFPHSEISGSKLTYSSPKHIGVRPVLHRLLVPRHSPCALSSLTTKKCGVIFAFSKTHSHSSSKFRFSNRLVCFINQFFII